MWAADPSSQNAIDTNRLSAGKSLAGTVAVILKNDEVLARTIERAGPAALSIKDLRESADIKPVGTTEVLEVTVTNENAQLAADLCNSFAASAADVMTSYVGGGSAIPINQAVAPTEPSSPGVGKVVAVGGAAGLCAAVILAILIAMFVPRVKNEEDLSLYLNVEVLTVLPKMRKG